MTNMMLFSLPTCGFCGRRLVLRDEPGGGWWTCDECARSWPDCSYMPNPGDPNDNHRGAPLLPFDLEAKVEAILKEKYG